MTEDVSTYLRMGVTLIMASTLVATTLNLLLISYVLVTNATDLISSVSVVSSANVISDLDDAEYVSAAEAWKFLNSKYSLINNVTIRLKNASGTLITLDSDDERQSEYESLRGNAEKNVTIDITYLPGDMMDVTIVEVG